MSDYTTAERAFLVRIGAYPAPSDQELAEWERDIVQGWRSDRIGYTHGDVLRLIFEVRRLRAIETDAVEASR